MMKGTKNDGNLPKKNAPMGKKGGRKAGMISKEEFLRKASTHMGGMEEDLSFSLESFMEIPAVAKDLSKIEFSTENKTASLKYSPVGFPLEGSLLGHHSLDNGLQFIGFSSGGDWEYPIFLIIYWDGKSFRGYIPTLGNSVNTIFKCAFGSEAETEYGPYGSKAHLVYHKYFEGVDDDELFNQCSIKLGYGEYGDNLCVNWEQIEEDIMNRIVVS